MTDHPYQLYALEFTEADRVRLAGFSCGDEVWSRCANLWIQGSDVLDSVKRGTKVWLFENDVGQTIGFGSVGPARWRWPLPDGSYTQLVIIPMLGLDARFRGQPPDPEWRYSRQMMSYLINSATVMSQEMAAKSGTPVDWLVMLVHRDNGRAIKFYQDCGFVQIPDVVRYNDQIVMKLWIGSSQATP
jgi:ribosomal protein S18 acetylase RimI-like enzyme